MEIQPYVLAELEDFSPLSSPLKSSQRIKFTCFDASQSFIVIGATSGGIYVFQRKPCVFLQLIPNTEGAITQVSVSPNESMFAFSTIKGVVFLIDHNVGQNSGGGVRKVQVSSDHRGAEVTAFQWNQQSNDLYIGDDKGKISVVSVSFFMAKTIFQAPSFTLMELDSKVVQMDIYNNFLLVSTLSRSYICDTVQEQYRRIGSRPRDGAFGACFQRVDNSNVSQRASDGHASAEGSGVDTFEVRNDFENARIFCARPGARLWEVGIGGEVVSTHKFAEALVVLPTPLVTIHSQQAQQDKAFTTGFTKLFPIGDQFLFTYERHSAYVIDPELAHMVLWSKLVSREEITDARTIRNVAYLWSGTVLALTLLTVEECLLHLFSVGRFQDCADLCLRHVKYLMKHAHSILPLSDLGKHVALIPEEMLPLLEEVTRLAKKAEGRINPPLRSVRRLESGIHVIGEGHEAVIDRKGLRDVRSGVAVVRSRSASPGSSLRKFGARPHIPAKDVGKRKGNRPGVALPSAVNAEAQSYSLPDLIEAAAESNASLPKIELKSPVKEEMGQSNLSEPVRATKNPVETLSLKYAEIKIRETWQELEDRVKSITWDFAGEAFEAVETAVEFGESKDFDEDAALYENEIIVQSRNRLLQKSRSVTETKPLHPVLDLKPVFDLSKRISACENVDESLIPLLFDSIFSVFDLFASKKREESLSNVEETGDNKEDLPVQFVATQDCISNSLPFPFRFYFPNDVIEVVVKSLEVLLCSNKSMQWLDEKLSVTKIDRQEIHPALKKCYSPRELQDDINFCAFIDLFEEIINPLRTLSFLSEANGPCRYLLWRKLVELLIAKPNGKTDGGGDKCLPSSLPAALPWLLTKFKRVRQINCSKLLQEAPAILLKERVPLRHCLYIIMWLCADDNRQNWHSSLLYILLASGDDCQDSIIQKCALDAFLESNESVPSSVLCRCGFPRVGAQGSSPPRFASVGIRLAQFLWQSGREDDCLKLCWNTGIWRWLLWFLHVGQRRKKEDGSRQFLMPSHLLSPLTWNDSRGWWDLGILPLLATLGDKWCLEEWLGEMDEEAWRKFLELRVKVLKGECLGCEAIGCQLGERKDAIPSPSNMSWTEVGTLMIESLGPNTSCRLLMESNSLSGAGQLDASFYKLCILATFASSLLDGTPASETLVKKFLKRMSSNKEVFSPKVARLIEGSVARDSSGWQAGEGDAIVPLPPSQPSTPHHHHWGCKLTLGKGASCPRCSLPIASQVLLSGTPGGLLVLPCGHSLHTVCARSSGPRCPLNCPPLRAESDSIEGGASQSFG